MSKFKNIAVYGGGSFGTSLASLAARSYNNITLFLRDEEIVKEILHNKTNLKYLGDIKLPSHLQATTNLDIIKDSELIIIAVQSYAFDDSIKLLKIHGISTDNTLLIATKGFARNPNELFSDRLKTLLPYNSIAFLSGPNLAKELAKNLPASASIASLDIDVANKIANNLGSKIFTTNVTSDIVTLQVTGVLKNIFAIKSGIDLAKEQGENARATLIVSALKEITILSKALGGMQEGLDILLEAGVVGDLVLTCYSLGSRNTKFGYELGISSDKKKFLQEYKELVEGREALKSVLDLIKKYNLQMPIISELASCVIPT
ncbi:MAG: NAD(P)H-dependent glycerol-3-phosphate dehydrogenase [Rickettsia endosymbiont of Ixodes persulcatus]|nr:NAD(P)H-dependent glycerol-3-phosphate dehydrogenase [Rickettsia endosymbiont of Ixodes persulcatus]MCZ6902113.1 NAD(P)H-dependent glycerol-3-phosphate dehydrogenase [Rickettsia endosymbiont of Ixodes persulcatus]MCZ6903706.1 NAD(P)H-dependent glycerol-3-phosphate dehydrogenase [Rickettsia endosymbiont of Ixodes persulcatus]MCZ6908538.1 NAD(P)H-dependent glycerol-3-phosphate dehydrogenase [Rickettsia endosymbiont of Ixodes persulcatus]MCZ6910297.1 NAD(P)H-dependent glycerol-3-phosphate dehyd